MPDKMEIINQIIAEHQANVLTLRDRNSIGEFDALLALQGIQFKCKQAAVKELINRKRQLIDTIRLVQIRLSNHYFFEEIALRQLFGDVFMKAIILQHSEIRQQIDKVMLLINDCLSEELSQDELAGTKSLLQDAISNLCTALVRHANLEEQMLRNLKDVVRIEIGPMKVC